MIGADSASSSTGWWSGVYIERQDIAGEEVWSVTTSPPGYEVRRRLFADRPAAYRYAIDQADWLKLSFFDLAGVPTE